MPQMTARKMPQRQRGGCGRILAKGVAKPHSSISFISPWLFPTHRPHPCRSSKIGEDESDPPKKGGSL